MRCKAYNCQSLGDRNASQIKGKDLFNLSKALGVSSDLILGLSDNGDGRDKLIIELSNKVNQHRKAMKNIKAIIGNMVAIALDEAMGESA